VLLDVEVARRLRRALERGYVLARNGAEQPPVLPADLRPALVADTERGLSLAVVEGCRPRPVGRGLAEARGGKQLAGGAAGA
jgi:hypothetical protein